MWEILVAAFVLATLYALIAVLKPIRPFKRRWSAAAAVVVLALAAGAAEEARVEHLKATDPDAYAALMAEREERRARREAEQAEEQARRDAARAAAQAERDAARAAIKAQERAREAAAAAERERRARCGDESMAWVVAKDLVKDRLRSPATADFPWLDYQAHSPKCGTYVVRSHVDSQNGFGAVIRTEFLATVRRTGKGRWVLDSLVTGG